MTNHLQKLSSFGQRTRVISHSKNVRTWSLVLLFGLLVLSIVLLALNKRHEVGVLEKSSVHISGEAPSIQDDTNPEYKYLTNHKPGEYKNSELLDRPKYSGAINSGVFNANTINPDIFAMRENSPTGVYQNQGQNQDQNQAQAINNKNTGQSVLAGSGQFSDYANHQTQDFDTIRARKIQHPEKTIAEGEFIQGYLETAINSDLPGMIEAVLSQPVYSYVGADLLIPKGSRLIGQYTAMTSNGAATERIFVVWNRLITPDGQSIMINSPGADALGRSGMGADSVNTHFWKIFGTSALLSILGAGVSNLNVSPQDQPNSADAYRQAISGSLVNSSSQVLNQNQNINPTLNLYQGDPITIFVAHDLDLS